MAIPAASRWWIATLVIVGLLLAISALALDRPNVVWDAHKPHCPSCRKGVEMHSSRCAACGGDFDWVVSTGEQSPLSRNSLSVLEVEWLRERVATLGAETAARHVAASTELSSEAALQYLAVGHGNCGWCGGTRKDLSAADLEEADACPMCLGTGQSIDSGGDRRVTLGNWAAERAIQAYEADMYALLRTSLPAATVQEEARRLSESFLRRFVGTRQAARVYFWPHVKPGAGRQDENRAVRVGRKRLTDVISALRTAE